MTKLNHSSLFKKLTTRPDLQLSESEKSCSFWIESWYRFKKNPTAFFGLITLTLLILMAIIGPYLNDYSYYEINLLSKNLSPSSKFWFGTDPLGRDLFTRTWWGARISLTIGISAALIDLIIGVIYGSIAGYVGKRVDETLMRLADILYSIPYLLVVILLTVVIPSGLSSMIIALTITGWIGMARIVRGQIIQLKNQDFALAARSLGASNFRLIFKHLLPNAMGPIITTMTLTIPSAIFAEAFLSFLGLGVQVPKPSWGTMAFEGLQTLSHAPWQLFFPAGFISLTMLSFNVVGDGLRDAFDPRIHQ